MVSSYVITCFLNLLAFSHLGKVTPVFSSASKISMNLLYLPLWMLLESIVGLLIARLEVDILLL